MSAPPITQCRQFRICRWFLGELMDRDVECWCCVCAFGHSVCVCSRYWHFSTAYLPLTAIEHHTRNAITKFHGYSSQLSCSACRPEPTYIRLPMNRNPAAINAVFALIINKEKCRKVCSGPIECRVFIARIEFVYSNVCGCVWINS